MAVDFAGTSKRTGKGVIATKAAGLNYKGG
jgi:hypothetical protein